MNKLICFFLILTILGVGGCVLPPEQPFETEVAKQMQADSESVDNLQSSEAVIIYMANGG